MRLWLARLRATCASSYSVSRRAPPWKAFVTLRQNKRYKVHVQVSLRPARASDDVRRMNRIVKTRVPPLSHFGSKQPLRSKLYPRFGDTLVGNVSMGQVFSRKNLLNVRTPPTAPLRPCPVRRKLCPCRQAVRRARLWQREKARLGRHPCFLLQQVSCTVCVTGSTIAPPPKPAIFSNERFRAARHKEGCY